MKIPSEWLTEIYTKIDGNPICRPSFTRIEKEIRNYIESDFNKNWEIPLGQINNFKPFFINTILSQCNPMTHALTCGINSEHALLIPRIHHDNRCYLVCPTCGYIQFFV